MKIKKLKVKKKYLAAGGDFSGNLDVTGMYNNNLNKKHIYLTSGERALAGVATGLANTLGLGSLVQAGNDAMGVTDQLNNSKEYKTAAGITGGVAGLGLSSVNAFAGMGKPKQSNIESPNTNITNMGYVTPEANPNDGSVEVNGLTNSGVNVWNALGGPLKSTKSTAKGSLLNRKLTDKFYNDLGNLTESPKVGGYNYGFGGRWVPPATDDKGGTTINGVYYGAQDLQDLTQYEASNDIDPNTGKPFKVFNDENDFKTSFNPVRRMDNSLNMARNYFSNKHIDIHDYTNPGKDSIDYGQNRVDSYTNNLGKLKADGGSLKHSSFSAKGALGNKRYNNKMINDLSNLTEAPKYNGYNYAQGGNMGLSEANGGFVHEDPNPMNTNQGVPINDQATVEVGETIFNPENYVFSDRIKVPGKKYTYADVSKKIKNKFKLRPNDKLSKEAITQDLTKLMNEQEAVKQAKAQKLMSKAMELNPGIMSNGGKLYPNGGKFDFSTAFNSLNNLKPKPYQLTEFEEIPENTQIANNIIPPNITKVDSGPLPGETEEELNTRLLSSTSMPKDLTGVNAGMFGLQALGEGLRLGLTPNSKLTGNLKFDRVSTYPQEAIIKKQSQETQANLLNAYRNSGVNPSQYLSAATQSIGQIGQNTGMSIAGINQQGQMTNAGIQAQEAQINKNLELQRNDIQAQDMANRSNQLGAVGAGLAQNMNTTLKDKSARDMDLYTMQFMNKDNYKLISTKEDADKYGQPIGSYIFVPSGYKEKTSKIKKKYKGK